jgi:hypothetical protein
MANNFFNAVRRNVSADSTQPTEVYKAPDTKKAILIELDVANKSSSGVTVTVSMCDESQNQTYDTTGTTINANASTMTITTGASSGLFTTASSAAHNLIVNDRVVFTAGSAPSFTDAALPPSGDTALSIDAGSGSRMYYVQAVPSASTFKIAESESATSALTFDNGGSTVKMVKVFLADIVRDAPVPVGGSLKVISGQKLVIESLHANVNDKIFVTASAANAVDCIASVLQEVS